MGRGKWNFEYISQLSVLDIDILDYNKLGNILKF